MEDTNTYTDVMVDTETTGLSCDRNGLLQIAAVKFNLKERTVSSNFFNMAMRLPPTRFWSESTRNWWLQDKRELLMKLMDSAQDPRAVIQAFAGWSYPAGHLRMWAKPSHFDFGFIRSYFEEYDMPMPFHFRYVTDVRSFLQGYYHPRNEFDPRLVEFDGEAHDAIFDNLHQIKTIFAALDQRDGVVMPPAEDRGNPEDPSEGEEA